MKQPLRALYYLGALASLGAGALGTVLPLLPTTPFLLLALWLGGRASPAFADWLLAHPRFGPPLTAWREHRAIHGRARILALAALLASAIAIGGLSLAPAIRALALATLTGVAAFIATRPEPPPEEP